MNYTYDGAGNLTQRNGFNVRRHLNVDSVNAVTNTTRSVGAIVAGSVASNAVSVTVNGGYAWSGPYSDGTWACLPALADGLNTFSAVAQDSAGHKATNTTTARLPVSANLQYDGNGNLTSDGHRLFYCDDENQLTNVTVANAWKSEFAYDGKQRRRIRREYTWSGGAWLMTNEVRYIYDGNLVIQERNYLNLPLATYTQGLDLGGGLQSAGGIGGLLARTDYSCAVTAHAYYFTDNNGNVLALIGQDQKVVARYLYEPFGALIASSGPLADANSHRFSSKEYDANSGLYYYGYRYYEANLQRWITRDPLGEQGGVNLYGFCGNDPVNRVDAKGLFIGYYPGFDPRQPALAPVPRPAMPALPANYYATGCTSDLIKEGQDELIKRYQTAYDYLAKRGLQPNAQPTEDRWKANCYEASCKMASDEILNFMSPTPPCWVCYVEWRERGIHYWPFYHDQNNIVCVSIQSNRNFGASLVFDWYHQERNPISYGKFVHDFHRYNVSYGRGSYYDSDPEGKHNFDVDRLGLTPYNYSFLISLFGNPER